MVMGVSAGCPNMWCNVCIDQVPNQMRELLGDGVQLARECLSQQRRCATTACLVFAVLRSALKGRWVHSSMMQWHGYGRLVYMHGQWGHLFSHLGLLGRLKFTLFAAVAAMSDPVEDN